MGLKSWLKWVPVFSLSKQQPSEPRVKRVHPTSPSHEQKVEKDGEGWGRLWELRRAASHPMVILMKLEGYFGWKPQCVAPPKYRERGLEPGVTGVEWIHACK